MLSVDSNLEYGGTIEVSATKTPIAGKYTTDAIITLTAIPADGYIFESWTGNVQGIVDPSQNPVTFTLGDNPANIRSITAMFAEKAPSSSSWVSSYWWLLVIVGLIGFVGLLIVLVLGWLIFFPSNKQVSG